MAALAPVMGYKKMRVLVRGNTVAATGAEFLARRMLIRHFVQKAFVVAPAPAVRLHRCGTAFCFIVAAAADGFQFIERQFLAILFSLAEDLLPETLSIFRTDSLPLRFQQCSYFIDVLRSKELCFQFVCQGYHVIASSFMICLSCSGFSV